MAGNTLRQRAGTAALALAASAAVVGAVLQLRRNAAPLPRRGVGLSVPKRPAVGSTALAPDRPPREGNSLPPAAPPASPSGPASRGQATGASDVASAAAFDRSIVAGLDGALPGTLEAYDFLRAWTLHDPQKVLASLLAYRLTYGAFLAQLRAQGLISAARRKAAEDILAGLTTANKVEGVAAKAVSGVLQVVGQVPAVGQLVSGVWNQVQQWVQAAAEAAAQGKNLWGSPSLDNADPVFAGFREGTFYFWDIPVWSFTVAMWVSTFRLHAGLNRGFDAAMQAFKGLALARPLGYPVPWVRIENDGSYSYPFIADGSAVATAASVGAPVRQVTVWSPGDISATGPRGFDPSNPWGWKVPGLKKSWYDIPGLQPVPWADAYWQAYLVALQDPPSGSLLIKNNGQNVDLVQGALDGLSRTRARDPKGLVPQPGQIPPGVTLPAPIVVPQKPGAEY